MTLPNEQLSSMLARHLDAGRSQALARAFEAEGLAGPVLALLGELQETSSKAAEAAVLAMPELHRRGALAAAVEWLDLGVAIASTSGAAALRYFAESPLILGLVPAAHRVPILHLALELADDEGGGANLALELLRKAPELLELVPPDGLEAWTGIAAELARCEYVVAIEFLRELPRIVPAVPAEQVRDWIAFGLKLVTRNSLGKTDYLGTLEFFRTSPALLAEIEDVAIRALVVTLGSQLASQAPELGAQLVAEAPDLVRRLPSRWRRSVLQYGLLVAERDGAAALAYLRRAPEVLEVVLPADEGEAEARAAFERWFKAGMEVLSYSVEGGRAYFAVQSRTALTAVQHAVSGVPLRDVARTLACFVEALSGRRVLIRPLPHAETRGRQGDDQDRWRAKVAPDGSSISLPPIVRRYPSRERNVRLYTVMTAHEAGHLEYGTYDLALERLDDLVGDLQARYGRPAQPVATLSGLFELYPQPRLAQDLWTLLEDARVEYRLQTDYPGLAADLADLARESVTTRSLLHGMSVRELVVDALLLLSTSETAALPMPEPLRPVVQDAWALAQAVRRRDARAEDSVRVADRIYRLLEAALTDRTLDVPNPDRPSDPDQGMGPAASESLSSSYRPVTNWAYRGAMDPETIRRRDETGGAAGGDLHGSALAADGRGAGEPGAGAGASQPPVGGEAGVSPILDRLLLGELEADPSSGAREDEAPLGPASREYRYDEWDGLIRDYRIGWCRVQERIMPSGDDGFIEGVRERYGPVLRQVRRSFESLRPIDLARRTGEVEGEDVDLDAAIRRRVERRAGVEPDERVYWFRRKHRRSVAVAFLVDLSGSTSRQIAEDARRIIDVEKEGLVLLAEALDALGDEYAVYGYSGQGRQAVDVWVLKGFDEPAGGMLDRVAAVRPLQQNRDGAAIRHVSRALLARETRVRLLVLLSDGRPLDDGYTDEYSLEDTRMALREARRQGIEPFCITVDREADDYLRRMYGDVEYLVIDRVEALPLKLPAAYRRLTA